MTISASANSSKTNPNAPAIRRPVVRLGCFSITSAVIARAIVTGDGTNSNVRVRSTPERHVFAEFLTGASSPRTAAVGAPSSNEIAAPRGDRSRVLGVTMVKRQRPRPAPLQRATHAFEQK
jgi:hypothetical protein